MKTIACFGNKITNLRTHNLLMSIKRLISSIFNKVEFLDKHVENPFLRQKFNQQIFTQKSENPFAKFFNGTYVWIDPPDNQP